MRTIDDTLFLNFERSSTVDQRSILDLLSPIFPILSKSILLAYQDFDKYHPEEVRPTVEGARPKWVHLRTMHYLEMEYGTSGSPRVIKRRLKGRRGRSGPVILRYLFVQGNEFNVGIRAKKVNRRWRSYNHRSAQQDSLRATGFFPWHKSAYHLILGYRDTGELLPEISHVGLTWEMQSRHEFLAMLWTAKDGVVSIQPEVQENLPLPPPPKYRAKRRRKPGKDSGFEGTGS